MCIVINIIMLFFFVVLIMIMLLLSTNLRAEIYNSLATLFSRLFCLTGYILYFTMLLSDAVHAVHDYHRLRYRKTRNDNEYTKHGTHNQIKKIYR